VAEDIAEEGELEISLAVRRETGHARTVDTL
jgi:hypothetical protein